MPLPEGVQPVPRATARESIYATLHSWIIDGTLRPGERLRDADLALHLGVSRTPVRETLQRLVHEGLVETRENRWTRVAPLDVGRLDQLYPIVAALESLAAKLSAPSFPERHLEAMWEANEKLRVAHERADVSAALAADARFHGAISEAAENLDLWRMLRSLRAQLLRLDAAYFDGQMGLASVGEHVDILESLRGRDSVTAAQALDRHWYQSLDRFRLRLGQARSESEDHNQIRRS